MKRDEDYSPTNYIQRLISEGEHVNQDFKFEISDARKIAKSLSAFANTSGGRLLVGVKDNGKIAGVRSEEEIYMIEAAAQMYCKPSLYTENQIYKVEGRDVLIVQIPEASEKPVYALDENNTPWAYIRIKDENILADIVHLNMWKHNHEEKNIVVTYTEREKHLLDIMGQNELITINRCSNLSKIPRKEVGRLIADFIRFNLVEAIFIDHKFYYRLKE